MSVTKIKEPAELENICHNLRIQGKKITHAHGVFDLFHIGHKKHLEIGKKKGDVLIVTITADQFVHKGPGRPIFPQDIRAEMLAALEIVDYVAISPKPSAEYIIECIKPDFYIKGNDYSNEVDDITGKIKSEKEVVYKNGGEVFITNEMTFSSSSLSNKYMNIYPEEAQKYLESIRKNIKFSQIKSNIEKLKNLKCLIIGETILDEYIYVEPLGKPSKENIISTRLADKEIFCGGVISTGNLLGNLCSDTTILTVLGNLSNDENFIRSVLQPSIKLLPFFRAKGNTIKKSRLVDASYTRKLFEFSDIYDLPLSAEEELPIYEWLKKNISSFDLVMVNDFGHGLISSKKLIEVIAKYSKFLAINVQTNSANRGYNLITKYPRADLICIDEPELRLATADKYNNIPEILKVLREKIDCSNYIITLGKKGCMVIQGEVETIPAFCAEPLDTIGAGDAFFAVAAPYFYDTRDLFKAGFIGNAAAAMKVRSIGHRDKITNINLLKYLDCLLK